MMRFRRYAKYVLVLGATATVSACGNSDPNAEVREARAQRANARASALAGVPQNLNAVTDWKVMGPKSTANVKDALIRSDGRPVAFIGRLHDVDMVQDSRYVIVNVEAWAPEALRFRLECNVNDTIRDEPIGRQLVGAATLSDVRMTRDVSMLALADLERRFLASGRCLYLKTVD